MLPHSLICHCDLIEQRCLFVCIQAQVDLLQIALRRCFIQGFFRHLQPLFGTVGAVRPAEGGSLTEDALLNDLIALFSELFQLIQLFQTRRPDGGLVLRRGPLKPDDIRTDLVLQRLDR